MWCGVAWSWEWGCCLGMESVRLPKVLLEGHFPAEAEEMSLCSSQLGAPAKSFGQPWHAESPCLLPARVQQEAWMVPGFPPRTPGCRRMA